MKKTKKLTKQLIGITCIITIISSTVGCSTISQNESLERIGTSTNEMIKSNNSETESTNEVTTAESTKPAETTTCNQVTESQTTTIQCTQEQITEEQIVEEPVVEEPVAEEQIVEEPVTGEPETVDPVSPYLERVATIRQAYETNDPSSLDEWDRNAFPGIKRCLDEAYNYSTTADREKFVHDWICNNTVYDMENYINGTIPYISHTYNGVFEKGVAVCDGYTSAFILIMNIMGIEAESQSGLVRGEGHSWAIVKLDDGEWYNVDVTFDDGDSVTYEYFNITTEQMQSVRSFYPKLQCNGTTYSYLNYFLPDREHYVTSPEEYKSLLTGLLQKGETASYVYITEAVAEQCILNYKYTYDTYANTGIGATVYCNGHYSPLYNNANEKVYKRELEIIYPKNFFIISSNKQLYDICRNELLNGNTEICYVTAPGYNIDTGIAYVTSRTEEIWQHIPVKEEYYLSHVIVLR